MSKSNTFENDLLKHIFNNDAIALIGDATEAMIQRIQQLQEEDDEECLLLCL